MTDLTPLLMFTLTLLLTTLPTKGVFTAMEPHPIIQYTPTSPARHRHVDAVAAMDGVGDRRMLVPFQLCLACRCCAANDPSNCATMPCCFRIDCNLPDKPFGVCAFVPKTCNCTSCQ